MNRARRLAATSNGVRRSEVTHETLVRDEYSGYLWSFQRNETHMTSSDTSEFLKQKVVDILEQKVELLVPNVSES